MPRRLALLLLVLLAGCSSVDPSQEEIRIVAPGNFKTGSGVITQVGVLPRANQTPTRDKDPNLYRLYIRMDLSGFQTVDIDSSRLMAGDAVDLTNDGRVLRVTGTSLNEALRGAR